MTQPIVLAVPLLVLLAAATAAQQQRWFELYDQAIQHVRRGEWGQAETKLNQAQKEGPAPGRTVLRYGMLRDDYFPAFYLGVVYLNTNRPKEALQQFQLVRSQKVNVQDREFQPIVDFETRAQGDVQKLAANTAPPPVAPANPATAAPPATVPVPAPTLPTLPAASAPDPGAEAKRLEAQFEQAIQNRDVTGARSVLLALQKGSFDQKAIAAFTGRVNALDGQIRLGTAERAAMRAFYGGDYKQAVSLLNAIERDLGSRLSPRGYFYRACGLAALALRAAPVDTQALTEARRQYGEATKSRQTIAPDRRYVSPRILQALGS